MFGDVHVMAIMTGCYLVKFCHLSPLTGAFHFRNVFTLEMLHIFEVYDRLFILKIPESDFLQKYFFSLKMFSFVPGMWNWIRTSVLQLSLD